MTPISQCLLCARWKKGAKCKAYPDGIPRELQANLVMHTRQFSGDGGVRFLQAKGKPTPVKHEAEG